MEYTENDLIIPTLEILNNIPAGVKTSDLIKLLLKVMNPSGKDIKILNNRKDTHFSQKVRNLKSHNALTRKELATYSDGIYKITDEGINYLKKDYKYFAETLREQGFEEKDRNKEFSSDYKGLVIEEGTMVVRDAKSRKRSRRLVKIARQYFSKDGTLRCKACGFDFSRKYGKLGVGYIEIHHTHPVHEHDIAGEKGKVEELLKILVPLCANCHRMVHRAYGQLLSIAELKKIVDNLE